MSQFRKNVYSLTPMLADGARTDMRTNKRIMGQSTPNRIKLQGQQTFALSLMLIFLCGLSVTRFRIGRATHTFC